MAIISGYNIIRTISSFHLSLAYFFLTAPEKVTDQNLVFLIGEAMGMPDVQSFSELSVPSSLLGLLFAFIGLTDILAVSMPDEVAQYHWGNQAPVRLLFFFAITGYAYLFKPGGVGASENYTIGAGDMLKNRVIFTWAFVEMITWFWIFVTLRDERREAAIKRMEKKKAEEDML